MVSTAKQVQPPFYMLTREALLMGRGKLKANNLFYTFLALQIDYPQRFGSEFRVDVKQFILSWGIPRSSFYKAISEMEEVKLLSITSAEVKLFWRDLDNSTSEELSNNRDKKSHIRDKKSNNRDKKSHIRDKKELEPSCSASSEPLQIYTDLKDLKDPEEDISFSEQKEEVAATSPTTARTFESPICENDPTQEGECSAVGDPQNFKNYVSFESPKNRPKLKAPSSSEAQGSKGLMNMAKSVICDTDLERPVTTQLVEMRRQKLAELFERGSLKEMSEQLREWRRTKDCSMIELLKHNPEWGFSVKHGRIVQEVKA